MIHPLQSDVRNRLLGAMLPDDFVLLQPHLRLTSVTLHQVAIPPNAPVERLFFPESGFVSVVSDGPHAIEVGLIGREGLVGATPLLLGSDRSPFKHTIQAPGELLAITTDDFHAAIDRSASLRNILLRFVQVLLVQTGQTAVVNASCDIETRLARWLLMCQDRLGGTTLQITHEFLAMMLGVQRSSVTLVLQSLEGACLIKARRGRIEVLERERLKEVAGEGYGVPEGEYARLIEGA